MMSPDPYSPGDNHWQSPTPERLPAQHAAAVRTTARAGQRAGQRPAQRTPQGGILQRQLMRLIGEILGDEGLNSEIRLSLLRHISEHPGHPEQAMLAHLHEIQERG